MLITRRSEVRILPPLLAEATQGQALVPVPLSLRLGRCSAMLQLRRPRRREPTGTGHGARASIYRRGDIWWIHCAVGGKSVSPLAEADNEPVESLRRPHTRAARRAYGYRIRVIGQEPARGRTQAAKNFGRCHRVSHEIIYCRSGRFHREVVTRKGNPGPPPGTTSRGSVCVDEDQYSARRWS